MSLSFDVYAEVKFNPCTNERELSKKLLKKIKDKIVRFNYERWTDYKMKEVAPKIKQWQVEELVLNDNAEKYIVKELGPIIFPNLKQLDLRWNHIQSIDHLCRLEMPSLQLLYIKHNHITIIKPLRKIYAPELKTLHLQNNEIRDMERLHELKMPKCINFELDGNYVYRIQGVDLRHFAKFEPPKLALTHVVNERVNYEIQRNYIGRKYESLRKNENRDNEQW